jgi:hypothetical protein
MVNPFGSVFFSVQEEKRLLQTQSRLLALNKKIEEMRVRIQKNSIAVPSPSPVENAIEVFPHSTFKNSPFRRCSSSSPLIQRVNSPAQIKDMAILVQEQTETCMNLITKLQEQHQRELHVLQTNVDTISKMWEEKFTKFCDQVRLSQSSMPT